MTSASIRRRTGAQTLGLSTAALGLWVSIVGAGQAPVSPTAPSTAAAFGAISGVVSDGATKRPLAGAVVQLASRGGTTLAMRAITDSKGRFVFRPLPASPYVLTTSRFGYLDGGLAGRVSINASQFSLAEREWIADANVVMWKAGAINGTILDERGEPVVGVPVRVLVQIPVAGQVHLAAGPSVKTDDRGSYRIAGLAQGRYVVTVPSVQSAVPVPPNVAPVFSTPVNAAGLDLGATRLVLGNYATPPPMANRLQIYPTLFFPHARSVSGATAIDLGFGEERPNVDFTLSLVPAVRITGTVTGPASTLSNLVVRLLPEGSEGLGIGSEVATAVSAADGSFTFLGVASGSYTLEAKTTVSELIVRGASVMVGLPATPGLISSSGTASVIGSAPDGVALSTRHTTGDDTYWGRMRLDVGADDLSNVVMSMRRGATVSGQIVYDRTNRPQRAPRVDVEPASGNAALGVGIPFRPGPQTPADNFTIAGLKDGEYFLRVSNVSTLVVKSVVVDGVDHTDRPFDASSGADISGVVITLTDKVAGLSGSVRDRQGVPVLQAGVILFPADKSLWTRFGFEPPRIKATSFFGKGGYKFSPLPKGDYDVIAVDVTMRDAWQDARFFPAAAASATRVSLDWGEMRVQDLTLSQVAIK